MERSVKVHRLPLRRKARIWVTRFSRVWPMVVWLLLAGFVFWASSETGDSVAAQGVVRLDKRVVAATETARVKAIHVEVGSVTQEWAVLVELESLELNAEISRLEEGLAARRREAALDLFSVRHRLKSEMREVERSREEDSSELQVLQAESLRLQALQSRGLVDADRLVELERQVASLEASLERYPAELLACRQEMHELVGLESAWEEGESQYEEMLGEYRKRRDALLVTSDGGWFVSELYVKVGDVVRAGDLLLESVSRSQVEVQGFVQVSASDKLVVGSPVYIYGSGSMEAGLEGVIRQVGPALAAIEDRSNPIMKRKVFGRRFSVELEAPVAPVDGEQVEIRFGERDSASMVAWVEAMLAW